MSYYIYILENSRGKHYVGSTKNPEERLKKHNTNQVRWTSKKGPWNILYKEVYDTRQEAYRREKQIKSYKEGWSRHGGIDRARLAPAFGGVPPEAAKACKF